MTRNVIFGLGKKTMETIHKAFTGKDEIMVLAPPAGSFTVNGPARTGKYKGYHRIKMEVWIPEEAIEGDAALLNTKTAVLLSVPKNRVKEHLHPKESDQEGAE